jgi:hypothetical protein
MGAVGCGTILAALARFRRLLARRLLSKGTQVSGC